MYSYITPGMPIPIQQADDLPAVVGAVCAGVPSPADDFAVRRIDLTAELVTHPQATFLLKVSGESMKDAGIFDGDMIVVNRALKPAHNDVVVAVVDGGEFTVKYLYKRADRVKLRPANATFPDIVPKEGQTLEIWGVVTWSIKCFRK